MAPLQAYMTPESLPGTESGRIGMLLGLNAKHPLDDIGLADRIAQGLAVSAAEALSLALGRGAVVGPLIPEATLRRAKKSHKALSREMSERLYEISRVVDAVSRVYHGDEDAISRFLNRPHKLLGGRSPMEMAQSNSAGAEAVINMLRRADSSFAV
jgi:putative toxin-antitoxin system antitoxin component (TIGR02293 family)